jgi:hypothetical protein
MTCFRMLDLFSTTLDAETGHFIRTTYGFMAGIIGLFLSSLCVIKVVCISYHLLLFSGLIVFAETRIRAFPEDRRKAWRQRICLKQIFIPFFASYHRFFFFTFAVSYSITASLVFSKLTQGYPSFIRSLYLFTHVTYLGCIQNLAFRLCQRVAVKM